MFCHVALKEILTRQPFSTFTNNLMGADDNDYLTRRVYFEHLLEHFLDAR